MLSVTGLAIAIPLVLTGPLISSQPFDIVDVARLPTSGIVSTVDATQTIAEDLDTSDDNSNQDVTTSGNDKIMYTLYINSHGQRVHLLHF
ncbi:hypothetical protein BM526_18825 (plasmid) [Alteromonas mediterranea]|uniref:hypothetical protein n=1 Tax=Alteromonas mediterranea TaxID=314275 RepID=UPI00090380E2|nr:hypothetical protein [Alteromonas mediterranea]APE04024.1 hypothetical protein BM526_18825 [Alteromonas mediterranea]